jgi:hypothetical protein
MGKGEGKENPVSLSAIYPHRIRLRGPWECELASDPVGTRSRVFMPCRWLDAGLADYQGIARFTRNFGYPGNIDESEHVWLTCAGSTGCRDIHINGHRLVPSAESTFAFDITSILMPRNRLEVMIEGSTDQAGLWGEVALEIRKDAYLADLHFESANFLVGSVVGAAPQPLELYTIVDGKHVDYRTIQPTVGGATFRLELPAGRSARVELIYISSIWYVVELPMPE